jgi:hypothetical protein
MQENVDNILHLYFWANNYQTNNSVNEQIELFDIGHIHPMNETLSKKIRDIFSYPGKKLFVINKKNSEIIELFLAIMRPKV